MRSSGCWSARSRSPRRTRTRRPFIALRWRRPGLHPRRPPAPSKLPPRRSPLRKRLLTAACLRLLFHSNPLPTNKLMGSRNPNPPQYTPQQEQPFMAHLIELRNRLLRMVLCVLLVFLVLFPFASQLYAVLAHPLLERLPAGATMIATEVASPFLTPFKFTFVLAVAVSMPYLLHQIRRFRADHILRLRPVFPGAGGDHRIGVGGQHHSREAGGETLIRDRGRLRDRRGADAARRAVADSAGGADVAAVRDWSRDGALADSGAGRRRG